MTSTPSPEEALADACARVGLSAEGAQVIYQRANAVYRLASAPLVARLRRGGDSPSVRARLTASIQVTRWLASLGFPTVRPADVPQPVTAKEYFVTFWHHLPEAAQPGANTGTLARLLRQLHQLPPPPFELPETRPFGTLAEDARRCPWLPEAQQSWLLAQCAELDHWYAQATWTLGSGLIHGDAYTDNLIHTPDSVVLSDWDSAGHGPREQDLVPTSIRRRFGLPESKWREFCHVYGVDPGRLNGFSRLERMRELRTLTAYLRTSHPRAQAEVTRRLNDLITGTQEQPWHGLNLAAWRPAEPDRATAQDR